MTLDKGDQEVKAHGWMGSGDGREIGEVWKEKKQMVLEEIDDLK